MTKPITASEEWDSMVEAANIALSKLTAKGDKLCRPKKYMGQIMAECDCQSKLCEDRGYCMADTPSPEAIVRAAWERAADEIDQLVKLPVDDVSRGYNKAVEDVLEIVIAFASDPAEVAATIKKAMEDRG